MKRPRPVRSAASSTRSTDWPHQFVVTSDISSDVPRCALLRHIRGKRCHGTAAAGRYRRRLTIYRKVSFQAAAAAAEPMRATWRNSLGLTPAWSRKKRVKCALRAKPSRSLTADRLSCAVHHGLHRQFHAQQIDIDVRRHAVSSARTGGRNAPATGPTSLASEFDVAHRSADRCGSG